MALQLLLVVGCLIMQIFMLIVQWKSLNLQRQNCNKTKKEKAANNASLASSRKTESNKEEYICLMTHEDDEDSWSKSNSKNTHKKKKRSKKRTKGKKKARTYIDWDETGTFSTASDIDQDNTAFTAKTATNSSDESDSEVSSSTSKDHNNEELQEAISELLELSQKLSFKNKQLKAQMKIHVENCKIFEENVISLKKENSDLKIQLDDIFRNGCSNSKLNSHLVCEKCKTFEEEVFLLEIENAILKNEIETTSSNASKAEILLNKPCENCKTLTQKLDTLENDLARFSKAKTDLNSFLKVQRTMNDKTGLGYKNVSKKGKQKNFHKPQNNSVLPSITCNYCMFHGHISTNCNIKKYGIPQGIYAWVKKAPKGITNFHGPKTIWVPKSS